MDLQVQGLNLRIREGGDPDGSPLLHFHGTPGSRLELAFGDDVAAAAGVRTIVFDRPGYGGSTPAPFSLASVGRLALEVADRLGLGRFYTSGLSGGGPFALATAVLGGDRVLAVGVMSGAGPFQLIPGALDQLSEGDKRAEELLPDDPEGAAAAFVEGFDLSAALADPGTLRKEFEPLLSESDRAILAQPDFARAFYTEVREAVRSGVTGCAWDNVAWIGTWDVDPTLVTCPVRMWYGTEDLMAEPAHANWLADHVPDSRLRWYEGEGHLLVFTHLGEMLRELLAAA